MVSEELKAIIDTLKNQGRQTESDMDFFEPATEDQISDFEKNNNLSFPSKFREWLLFSDGGECFLPASVQFYGVAHKPLIDVSNQTRPDDSYVVIGGTPNGDPVLIKKDSETISIYNKEEGKIEEEEVYDDFFAFLNGLYDYLGMGEWILWQEIMLLVTEQSEKHGRASGNLFLLEKAHEIGHQSNENN